MLVVLAPRSGTHSPVPRFSGVGGVERQEQVRVGSVVESLLQEAPCPIFLVSAVQEGSKEFAAAGPAQSVPSS